MADRTSRNRQLIKVTLDEGMHPDAVDLGPDFKDGLALPKSFEQFGEHARKRRIFLSYPQSDVARFMNRVHGISWHQTVVAKIEAGERSIRANEAFALAHIYDIDLHDLAQGKNLTAPFRWVFDTTPDGRGVDVVVVAGFDTSKRSRGLKPSRKRN